MKLIEINNFQLQDGDELNVTYRVLLPTDLLPLLSTILFVFSSQCFNACIIHYNQM